MLSWRGNGFATPRFARGQNSLFLPDLYGHAPSAETGRAQKFVLYGNHFQKFFKFFPRPVFIAFFAPAQFHLDLYLVSFTNELLEFPYSHQEIVVRRAGTDLNLFGTRGPLRKTLFFLLFLLLVAVLVVAHQPRDGRPRGGSDLYKVNAFLRPRERHGFFTRHDSEVFAVGIYDAQRGRCYLIIDSRLKDG